MQTINLIPDNYSGDPRSALGYAWKTLVMDGWKVDRNQSIPGDDLTISLNECLDMMRKEHGFIAIRNNNNYGWVKSTADADGVEYDIDTLEQVAYINCMWCGGASLTVYRVKEHSKKVAPHEKLDQEWVKNPAYAHMTDNEIKAAEIKYDNLQNEGYSDSGNFNPYRDHLFIQKTTNK